MTAVAKMPDGQIRDATFQCAIRDFNSGALNPHTPVAMAFASARDANRFHFIGGCETCYENWRRLA